MTAVFIATLIGSINIETIKKVTIKIMRSEDE
jgi:hypothetical protein